MTSADLVALLKKHPIGFGCGLVSIICGVLLYLRAGDIAASQADLDLTAAQATKMAANVRNSSNLPEQVTEMQAIGKELDARVMKAGQLAVNLQYFYKLETETEVKLVDVRQNQFPRNLRTMYGGVPFNVAVQGSFKNVINFANRLQNGRHFCRITTSTFTKAGESGDINLALSVEILGQP